MEAENKLNNNISNLDIFLVLILICIFKNLRLFKRESSSTATAPRSIRPERAM